MAKHPIQEETLGAIKDYPNWGAYFIPWYWEWSYDYAIKHQQLPVMTYAEFKIRYEKRLN